MLPEEFTAACEVLGCHQETSSGGRIYKVGLVPRRDNDGGHVVVVARVTDMGNNAAAARAAKMVQDCPNISELIMCGIAGAVPNPSSPADHVRLGDIVITSAEGVIQYDFVRETDERIVERPRPRPPSRRLLEVARFLESEEHRGERPWDRHVSQAIAVLKNTALGARWERPPGSTDRLCEFTPSIRGYAAKFARAVHIPRQVASYASIPHPRDSNRIDDLPRVFHGAIGSANNLQKNPNRRNELRDRYRIRAIEMEGSGLAEAAYQSDVPYFIVRGTCDYCNEDKDDVWHHYAAVIAAAYTRALIEATPLLSYLAPAPSALLTTSQVISPTQVTVSEPVLPFDANDLDALEHSQEKTLKKLEDVFGALAEDLARERTAALRQALDSWEFASAFALVEQFGPWMDRNEKGIGKGVAIEAYEVIVRTEIVRANQLRTQGKPLDLTRAEHYLRKARNVLER